jgi:putative transcriptional regulator
MKGEDSSGMLIEVARRRSPCQRRYFLETLISALLVVMMLPLLSWAGPAGPSHDRDFPVSPVSVPRAASGPFHLQAEIGKGKFLVADRNLTDPRFSGTVILIVDHGPYGAMGLVINRPKKAALSEVFPELEGLRKRTDAVFFGGPVRTDQLFMLIRSPSKPEDSHHVFMDVYLSGSKSVLRRIIEAGGAEKRFRVFAGYAGWGARQLEGEVARGDWHVLQADVASIFEKDPAELWPELFRKGSAKWVSAGMMLTCRMPGPGAGR